MANSFCCLARCAGHLACLFAFLFFLLPCSGTSEEKHHCRYGPARAGQHTSHRSCEAVVTAFRTCSIKLFATSDDAALLQRFDASKEPAAVPVSP